jgi:hypothetical protein
MKHSLLSFWIMLPALASNILLVAVMPTVLTGISLGFCIGSTAAFITTVHFVSSNEKETSR